MIVGEWGRPASAVLDVSVHRVQLERSDFNLIHDEARAVMGEAMPASFSVQQRVDPVTRAYLASLDVETVDLFSWNHLPEFLREINSI